MLLRYINANYTNYRLLKINDNEKYEFATEDSDVDKDITIFQDSNYTYLYNNIPINLFVGFQIKITVLFLEATIRSIKI